MGTILKAVGKFTLGAVFAGWGAFEIVENVRVMNSAINDMSDYAKQKNAAKEKQEQA